MKVKCPQCKSPALFSAENPFRPFCSERCKLIDLGEWADGQYRISTQDSSEHGFEDQGSPDDPEESRENREK